MMKLNEESVELFEHTWEYASQHGLKCETVGGAKILDAGIGTPGSLDAGLFLARVCMGDQAEITLVPCDENSHAVSAGVFVRTDTPTIACLGAQYAGWPVQTDDFFAMGSGPMRLMRGREAVLKDLRLAEEGTQTVGVLEADRLPTESAIALIAEECGVSPDGVFLGIAPSSSLAGSLQVVARSIETAMHKLHELEFNVDHVVSATGYSPLPPPAKRGDSIAGIGRTNDAMLYGATVTMWVDCSDDEVGQVIV